MPDFYLNPSNTAAIRRNIKQRNSDADIDSVIKLNSSNKDDLNRMLKNVPNMSHPLVQDLDEPKVIFCREFETPDFKIQNFDEISR